MTQTTAERIAAEREREADMNRRHEIEAETAKVEQEAQYIEALHRGEQTSRQRRAEEVLSYLHQCGQGRWQSGNETAASYGSQFDLGRALDTATRAAQTAVAAALLPLVEAAEAQARAADEERDAIVAAYQPPRSRWLGARHRG